MDAVDASAHYEVTASDETPALLTIVLDTNPRAWAALADTLPLSKAVANLLVFVNSHLALSSANQVAVVASHCNRAVWLYPATRTKNQSQNQSQNPNRTQNGSGDVDMTDIDDAAAAAARKMAHDSASSANKFPQFHEIETTLLQSVHDLVSSTTEGDLDETTTQLAGALTLALAHINKTALLIPSAASGGGASGGPGRESAANKTKKPGGGVLASGGKTVAAQSSRAGAGTGGKAADDADDLGLHARILVLSVSDSSPAQYIPTMNAVFAAAHAGVAIDVLALRGTATFLQQASYITRGTFVNVGDDEVKHANGSGHGKHNHHGHPGHPGHPSRHGLHGLLAYLMLGFSAASAHDVAQCLVAPSADAVDFRAACFCHRRVVDTGFVCSICLSIFCEVPGGDSSSPTVECLTCGSQLRLGSYGAKPAVIPRPKKKKKKRLGISSREETASTVGTPAAS